MIFSTLTHLLCVIEDKIKIMYIHSIYECCSENIGESIIYMWVESVREFVISRLERNSEAINVDEMASQSQEVADTVGVSGMARGDLATTTKVTEGDGATEGKEEEERDWKFYANKKNGAGKVPGEIASEFKMTYY